MEMEKRNYSAWRSDTGFCDALDMLPDPRQDLEQPEPNYWRQKSLSEIKKLMAPGGFEKVLSSRQAEIFRLRAGGLTVPEVSKLLKLSSRTITAHMQKSKEKLRQHINNTAGGLE